MGFHRESIAPPRITSYGVFALCAFFNFFSSSSQIIAKRTCDLLHPSAELPEGTPLTF
jgi:hypothetical protein